MELNGLVSRFGDSALRRLTGLIREVHVASRGTYGYHRVHAELTLGMGIQVCSMTVSVLMTQAGIYGLPGPVRIKRLRGVVTADDLVNRKFHRLRANELWVTDITQHLTTEGWVYCAAVLDAFSRKIVGWSIDSRQDATLVVNALLRFSGRGRWGNGQAGAGEAAVDEAGSELDVSQAAPEGLGEVVGIGERGVGHRSAP